MSSGPAVSPAAIPDSKPRDLVHLACCIRRKPRDHFTFDRGLAAAWEAFGG